MKVLSKSSTKQVMFGGENFRVPDFVKFIAVDADGMINGFASRPKPDDYGSEPMNVWIDPDCNEMYYMGHVELEGENWKYLLTEV